MAIGEGVGVGFKEIPDGFVGTGVGVEVGAIGPTEGAVAVGTGDEVASPPDISTSKVIIRLRTSITIRPEANTGIYL